MIQISYYTLPLADSEGVLPEPENFQHLVYCLHDGREFQRVRCAAVVNPTCDDNIMQVWQRIT